MPIVVSKHISIAGLDSLLTPTVVMTKSLHLSLQHRIHLPYITTVVSILHSYIQVLINQTYQNVVSLLWNSYKAFRNCPLNPHRGSLLSPLISNLRGARKIPLSGHLHNHLSRRIRVAFVLPRSVRNKSQPSLTNIICKISMLLLLHHIFELPLTLVPPSSMPILFIYQDQYNQYKSHQLQKSGL